MNDHAYVDSLVANKELDFTYRRRPLRFQVSQELFSSFQVDAGTRLLLKTVSDLAASDQVKKVLDMGCGYGPLGLALAAADSARRVHLVDRDALAVTFARHNARVNDLSNTAVYGSLGYDDVTERDFDLLLCNIPGKVGRPVIESLLLDARSVLSPQGVAAIVVVPPLAAPTAEILDRPDVQILLREQGAEHIVFHYRFLSDTGNGPAANGFERGLYDRGQMEADYRGLHFSMQTVRGLPEFDDLSHQTAMVLSVLQKRKEKGQAVDHALVFNPGQGHTAAALSRQLSPQHLTLVDRDLLSLRASQRNLQASGYPGEQITLLHQPGLPAQESLPPADLILGVLRDGEGPQANLALVARASHLLSPQGEVVVAGASTTITRLEKHLKREKLLVVIQRKRNRAKRLLILGQRNT